MIDPISLLKKLLECDVYIYTVGMPGAGFDYSWVALTEDEALFLKNLQEENSDDS